jgi:tetratricopeptide (TPR) repeat protein
MTAISSRFSFLLALVSIAACTDTTPPSVAEPSAPGPVPKVAMTPPPLPASVAVGGQAPPASRPVGPHGEHDPHATLDPERLIKVALQHETEGRLELALKTLAEGIAKFPDSAQLYAVRASLRLQMQQVSAALSDLEKAVERAPDDARIRVNRAQAYRAFGRHDEAMRDLNLAVEREPDLLPARFNRGALLYAKGEFDEALVDFEHCLAVDPHSPAPYFNRASTYWELGRPELALKDLERFLELSDNAQWKQAAEDLKKNWEQVLASEAASAKSSS